MNMTCVGMLCCVSWDVNMHVVVSIALLFT